jgi:hypothetical protein
MSLRNSVVDAGDEVKVDGEWRMPPPKVDIVEDSSPALRDHAHFGHRGLLFFLPSSSSNRLGNSLFSPRAFLTAQGNRS